MKEFSAKSGGRYTYVDDILNLQDISLAFAQLFDGCDNFIISGCEVNSAKNGISGGYVYINGKVRKFDSVSYNMSKTAYIYEANSYESVTYADTKSLKEGRVIYGTSLSNDSPASRNNDPVTGEAPGYITIDAEKGAITMQDAFLGRYSLLKNPLANNDTQAVKGDVAFEKNVDVLGNFAVSGEAIVGNFSVSYNSKEEAVITINNSFYKVIVSKDNGVSLAFDDTTIASFKNDEVTFLPSISAPSITVGRNLFFDYEGIYNSSATSDTASVWVNKSSADGGSYYRDFIVGDGKGVEVVTVSGKDKKVTTNGTAEFSSDKKDGVVLKCSKYDKSSASLQKSISWVDSASMNIAEIGFMSNEDSSITIKNVIGDVNIEGVEAVNIIPAIKENGVLLYDKYANKVDNDKALADKADKSDVFTKDEVRDNFGAKSEGLSQFIPAEGTVENLRDEIQAVGSEALDGYAKNENFLSDMAKEDGDKKKIRNNIDVYSKAEAQERLADTGWVQFSSTNGGLLYARQIGNLVNICGSSVPISVDKTWFNIPGNIDPPKGGFTISLPCGRDVAALAQCGAGQRECKMIWNEGAGNRGAKNFSVTYFV